MTDVKQQVNAVRRTLGDRTLEAGQARVVTLSQVYDTGLDDLWDVVTSAERIPRWFLPVSGDLVQGGRFQFEGNAGGTITSCDKPNGYAATWEMGDQISWVEVRLVPEGAGRTRFELEHVAPVAAELWDLYGPAAVGMGWDSGFLGLANYLSGDPAAELDPRVAMAWVATAQGKEFMRLTADAWAAAAIAYGDDPEAARASAGRTYEAYTATE
ncbi:SRPBCC family protein [Actinoplanes sp. NPDC051494]|uniref:SRPBCC family protein n=1 Tax=Actinoplanes sp. NPDC051494 TaxID=3363907 RepID=UPI0037BBC219